MNASGVPTFLRHSVQQRPVAVEHRVQSMCNRQHRAVGKLTAYRCLNQLICLNVHRSCSLIQHQDRSFAEQGTCQTHQLSLSNTTTTDSIHTSQDLQLLAMYNNKNANDDQNHNSTLSHKDHEAGMSQNILISTATATSDQMIE